MIGDRIALVRRWLEEYAPHPHPLLGRDGVVCPYMVRALRRDFVRISGFDVSGYRPADDAAADVLADLAHAELRTNLSRAEQVGPDRTYLVSMIIPAGWPDAELRGLVDRVHSRIKPAFIRSGFMAGDFWPDHETVGLHNADFRPFTSPVPVLGMRPLVPADLAFFVKHEPTPQSRLRYLRQYAEVFAGTLNAHWAERLAEELDTAERDVAAGAGQPSAGAARHA
nr:hypothetical protein asmbl_13 [uncultured bacterium]